MKKTPKYIPMGKPAWAEDHIPPQQGLRQKVHMEMLSKSRNAKDVGDLTVVPLGFAVTLAIELIAQTRTDTIREVDPFNYVEPCEPECSPVRHARHQGQWDMAERMRTTLHQELEQLKGQR